MFQQLKETKTGLDDLDRRKQPVAQNVFEYLVIESHLGNE